MRGFCLVIIFSFVSVTCLSQVSGKVISVDGSPLPFVNVLLLQETDSSMVQGVLSQHDGSFVINDVPHGSYLIYANMIGYAKWYSSPFRLTHLQPGKTFDDIILAEEATLLEGIQVTGQQLQVEQTKEGTVLNVHSSVLSKGSTALQILERSPGVVLDPRNNNLMLNGQSGVMIMINGKPMRISPAELVTMLEGISADNLAKVELLTNPSAKYDADGSAGIINLVMKKSVDEGISGSVSVTAGYGWGAKQAVGLNLNHRRSHTSHYFNYAFNRDHYFTDFHAIGSQSVPALGGDFSFDFKNNSARDRLSHNIATGIEREMKGGWTVGSNFMFNNTSIETDIYNDANYQLQHTGFLHGDFNISGKSRQNNLNAGLFLEKQLGRKSKFSWDGDYLYYENYFPTIASNAYKDENGDAIDPENPVYTNGNIGASTTDINIGVMKMDFETKLSKSIALQAGIKGTYSKTTNDAYIRSIDDQEMNGEDRDESHLTVMEKIGASYFSLDYTLDSLTTLTMGLRYEHWDRDFSASGLDSKFGKLFPSLFVSRTLKEGSSLQLAYSRRITRPDYNDLTNYLRYNDPVSVFTGTPELNPAIMDNIKIGYQVQDKMFSIFYTYEQNPIARFQTLQGETNGLVLIAPENIDFIKSWGVQTHFPLQITSRWSLALGGSLSQRAFRVSYTKVPASETYLAHNIYANQNFSLPEDFSLEISCTYNSDYYNGSIKVLGYGWMNLGLKKELPRNWGSVQFTVTDVLESMTIRSVYGGLTRENFDAESVVRFQPESANNRIFRISYSKTIGNRKIAAAKKRQSGSVEERSRMSQ